MKPNFLYIAGGRLHLKLDGAPFRFIDSEFGKATQERIIQIQRRNIFRDQGMMASRVPSPMLKQMEEQANTPVPVNFTSVCCASDGKIYYALNVGDVAGVFTGELIDLHKLSQNKNRKEGKTPGLVPDSWQLICKKTGSEGEVIATGVLYYDLTADGSILYTNGNTIYYLKDSTATSEKLFDHKLVEQLTF